jgi:predicted phosphodiesterase
LSWTGILNDLLNAVSDSKYANPTGSKISLNKFPNETSVKSLVHLGQLVANGAFMEMQDSPCFLLCASPIVLPLNTVTTPIMLINGAEDPLADTTDVNWLAT